MGTGVGQSRWSYVVGDWSVGTGMGQSRWSYVV